MPPNNEEFHTSAMVDAVREMSQELRDYKAHADQERSTFRAEVWTAIEAMRKDVYAVVIRLQLENSQHRDDHTADRAERATDAVDRLNRQLTLNMWLGALTVLVVVNLFLIAYIVIRVALVIYGR